MTPERLVEWLWRSPDLGAALARAALTPLARCYASAVTLRRRLYLDGWLAVRHVGIPVVSVGNLVVGGSGKTPVVIWLAQRLRERGFTPAVVGRGYGAATTVVTEIAPERAGAGESSYMSDEGRLVALRTGCGVVTCADRYAACRRAEERLRPDVILLDDGFQHLRLARDLDLVLLDGSEWSAATLPAGPLRERRDVLARAEILLAPRGVDAPAGVHRFSVRPAGLVERVAASAEVTPCAWLSGREIVAVAGIARPERFLDMLARAGANVQAALTFADHHAYTELDWQRILRMLAAARAAECVVTTEKDLVKLARFPGAAGALRALRIELEIDDGEALIERVAHVVRGRAGAV